MYSAFHFLHMSGVSLFDLVSYIARQYGISPEFIKCHRDFNSTEGPVQVLYYRPPELRTAVGRVLGVTARAAQPAWPLLKPGDTGPKVLMAQRFLRAAGFAVPADGVFGTSTKDTVAALAIRHDLPRDTCTATRATD